MATLNRNYSLYSETRESSLEKHNEWGLDFMRSYKVKPTSVYVGSNPPANAQRF